MSKPMGKKGIFRISGKSVALPEPDSGWKLTSRPGGWWIAERADGRRVRFAVAETRSHLSASLTGRLWHGEVPRDTGAASAAATGGGESDLIAQFPGKVRKILVSEGAAVTEGDPLVLVEAMKMEFTIKAPFSGKVTRILVKEAQQLSPGDRFLELEPVHG